MPTPGAELAGEIVPSGQFSGSITWEVTALPARGATAEEGASAGSAIANIDAGAAQASTDSAAANSEQGARSAAPSDTQDPATAVESANAQGDRAEPDNETLLDDGALPQAPAQTQGSRSLYTATITLAAQEGFSFEGIADDFFSVEGADASHSQGNTVTAEFSAQELSITPLATGISPLSLITGTGYTFDTNTRLLTITTNAGTTNWRNDTNISSDYTARYNAIKYVAVQSEVTTLQNYAFGDCSNLISVSLPSSLKTVGNDAFRSCTSLTALVIPEGVTTIGFFAFAYCRNLVSVVFPSTLTTFDPTGLVRLHLR